MALTIDDGTFTTGNTFLSLADINAYHTLRLTSPWVSEIVNAVAAQGKLTIAAQPTANDTMTIGTTVYTFKAAGSATTAGTISIGTDLATAKTAIIAALKGTDGVNTAHATITPADTFSTNDLTLTAKTKGADGNSIATTETFTNAGNIFDAATLGTTTAGVNENATKEAAIIRAFDYLAIQNWKSDTFLTEIPTRVEYALCVAANKELDSPNSLQADQQSNIKRKRIEGAIDTEYFSKDKQSATIFTEINNLIAPYLETPTYRTATQRTLVRM